MINTAILKDTKYTTIVDAEGSKFVILADVDILKVWVSDEDEADSESLSDDEWDDRDAEFLGGYAVAGKRLIARSLLLEYYNLNDKSWNQSGEVEVAGVAEHMSSNRVTFKGDDGAQYRAPVASVTWSDTWT